MIFNILDNTTELWMTKYIIGENFSSCGANLYNNPSDQTVSTAFVHHKPYSTVQQHTYSTEDCHIVWHQMKPCIIHSHISSKLSLGARYHRSHLSSIYVVQKPQRRRGADDPNHTRRRWFDIMSNPSCSIDTLCKTRFVLCINI